MPQNLPRPRTPPPPPARRFTPGTWIIVLLVVALIVVMMARPDGGEELTYSQFLALLANGQLLKVQVGDELIEGEYQGDLPGGTAEPPPPGAPAAAGSKRFYTVRIRPDDKLIETLREKNVPRFEGQVNRHIGPTLLLLLPTLLLVGFLALLFMRRVGGYGEQVMAFGKSKARISLERNTGTTFADVAGCEEAKEELQEIIAYLKSPDRFRRLGGKIPKGVMLAGPPGTGKTLIARAVAGEAGVPFITVSGPEFMEMFVGVGAARVRDLFAKAKQKAPCIIFVDEIDAVGRHRGAGLGGGQEEREQTLNQLLVEMDGFEPNAGIIVLAATNRPDILDPALLRPGRFDRQVVLDHPDAKGREAILEVHARGKALGPEVDLKVVAARTPGFTGADLANVMNEAALLAARRDRDKITMADVEEAIDRVMTGPERRSRVIRPREKEVIAYHECGHALVASSLPGADPVHKVSIVPRGHGALGYTLQLPETDRYLVTKRELLDKICVSLGGRTAEELAFGEISTGAENDLDRVTDLARSMVCRFGMSEKVGPLTFERADGRAFLGVAPAEIAKGNFSQETLATIDSEVARIVRECRDRTREILTGRRTLLERLAKDLLEVEVMDATEFAAALERHRKDLGLSAPASPPPGGNGVEPPREKPEPPGRARAEAPKAPEPRRAAEPGKVARKE